MKKELIKILVIFFVTVGAVVFGLNYLFLGGNSIKSRATGETMNLSFNPVSVTTTAANQDFAVTILAQPSINTVLRGYKARVNFDKNILSFKSIEYKLGVVSDGLGATTADAAAINNAASGQINIMGEIQVPADGYTLTSALGAELVTITFTAKSTTSTSVSISDAGFYSINGDASLFADWVITSTTLGINSVVVTPTVTPGPSSTPTPTVTPGGPSLTPTLTPTPTGTIGCATGNVCLNLKLKFQGINKLPAAGENSMYVKVRTFKEGNPAEIQGAGTFVADANGVWSGKVGINIADLSGKYKILVKGDHHIQKRICNGVPTEVSPGTYSCAAGDITLAVGNNNLDFSGVMLLAGDLDQSGVVDSVDFALVRNNLGKKEADILAKADINRDGVVDTQDYSAIIFALSVKVDEM